MARWYCPKCREVNLGHWTQNPATGNLHCNGCGTRLDDLDAIDEAVREYEVQGC